MLHQVNYQELKSLALQYPYSANLRYLMLVKSLLDSNREYDRNLVLASLGSIDRKKLRQLVKQYSYLSETSGNYELSGEFLELKDLSTLEEVLEAVPTEVPKAAAMDVPNSAVGLDFLDDLQDETLEENPIIDLEEEDTGELEDLIEHSPVAGSGNSLDALFEMDKPLTNRIREADIEDLEIEESNDDLFDDEFDEEDWRASSALPDVETSETSESVADDEPSEPSEGKEDSNLAQSELPAAEILEDIGIDSRENLFEDEEMIGEPAPSVEELLSTDDIPLEITNDETSIHAEEETADPKPLSKNVFPSYQYQIQRTKSGLLTGDFHILPKEEKKRPTVSKQPKGPLEAEEYEEPKDVAKDVAAKSLSEDNTIATETLAGILERQGHFDKAIKMYEKLSLQYPEKSSTFAAKIEKLKNK